MIYLNKRELFSKLPSVDEVLNQEDIKNTLEEYPRNLVIECIRKVIDRKEKK